MGKEIDNHVAKLDLDSSGFLKGAEEVLKAIGKLETALEFKGAEKGFASVVDAVDSMRARVSGTLADTVSQMSAFTGSVSQAASTAVSSMNTVLAAVDGAASSVASSVTASASATAYAVMDACQNVSTAVTSMFAPLAEQVAEVSQSIENSLSGISGSVVSQIQTASSAAETAVGAATTGISAKITGVLKVVGVVAAAAAAIGAAVAIASSGIAGKVSVTVDEARKKIQNGIDHIKETVSGGLDTVKDKVSAIGDFIKPKIDKLVNDLKISLRTAFPETYAIVSQWAAQVGAKFDELKAKVQDACTGLFTGIKATFDGIRLVGYAVIDELKTRLSIFVDGIAGVVGPIVEKIQSFAAKISSHFRKNKEEVDALSQSAEQLSTGLSDAAKAAQNLENALSGTLGDTSAGAEDAAASVKSIADAFSTVTPVAKEAAESTQDVGDSAEESGGKVKEFSDDTKEGFEQAKEGAEETKESTDEVGKEFEESGDQAKEFGDKSEEGFEKAENGADKIGNAIKNAMGVLGTFTHALGKDLGGLPFRLDEIAAKGGQVGQVLSTVLQMAGNKTKELALGALPLLASTITSKFREVSGIGEHVSVGAKVAETATKAVGEAAQTVGGKFTALGAVAFGALERIGQKALDTGTRLLKSLSVDNISQGWNEYGLKINSTQTIMASTGESLATVNGYLEDLNKYADRTIYSFSDMTQNIGKFTNAGVDLKTAVAAIQGISNEAALSGANAQEASRAMYNFAQALSAGYVKLIDWKSIENANMATKGFKEQLIQTAAELGTVKKAEDGYISTTTDANGHMSAAFTATKNFNDSLSAQWMTTEVLTKTLAKYADETTEFGKKAYAAAQDIKTGAQLMDTLKEAVGSGWSRTFELVIGDLEEAKKFWTGISNMISPIIDGIANARNSLLEGWRGMGGRDDLITSLNDGFTNLIDIVKAAKEGLETFIPPFTANKLKDVTDAIGDFIGKIKLNDDQIEKVKDIFEKIGKGAKLVKDSIKEIGTKIGEPISSSGALSRFREILKDLFGGNDIFAKNGLLDAISEVFDKINSFALNNVVGTIRDNIDGIASVASNAISIVSALFQNIGQVFSSFGPLLSGIGSTIAVHMEDIRSLVDGVISVITGLFDVAGSLIRRYLNGFSSWMPTVLGVVLDVVGKIGEALSKLGEWLSKNADLISGFVKAFLMLKTAVVIVKVIAKIVSVCMALTSVIGTIKGIIAAMSFASFLKTLGVLKVAIGAVTGALGAFLTNLIAIAGPILVGVAALGAMAAGIYAVNAAEKKHREEVQKDAEETYKLTDRQKELADAVKTSAEKYEDLAEAREKSTSHINTEYDKLNLLVGELRTITDEEGKVKAGEEEHAKYILGELSKALGEEYNLVDGQIQKYGELNGKLDETIEKKRTLALLNAGKEEYEEAYSEQGSVATRLLNANRDLADAENKLNGLYDTRADLVDKYNKELEQGGNRYFTDPMTGEVKDLGIKDSANFKLSDLSPSNSYYGALEKNTAEIQVLDAQINVGTADTPALRTTAEQAHNAYVANRETIDNYEQLEDAYKNGTEEDRERARAYWTEHLKTVSGGATLEELRKQMDDQSQKYVEMKDLVDQGLIKMPQESLDGLKYAADLAANEFATKMAEEDRKRVANDPKIQKQNDELAAERERRRAESKGDKRVDKDEEWYPGYKPKSSSSAIKEQAREESREAREAAKRAKEAAANRAKFQEEFKASGAKTKKAYVDSILSGKELQDAGDKMPEIVNKSAEKNADATKPSGDKSTEGFLKGLLGQFFGVVPAAAAELPEEAANGASANAGVMQKPGEETTGQYARGVESAAPVAESAGKAIGESTNTGMGSVDTTPTGVQKGTDHASGVSSTEGTNRSAAEGVANAAAEGFSINDTYQIGYQKGWDYGLGLEEGMRAKLAAVAAMANTLAGMISATTSFALKENSPSKVAIGQSEYYGEGLVIGMQNMEKAVRNESMTLSETLVSGASTPLSSVSDILSGEFDDAMTITPVMDLSRIQNDAGRLRGMLDDATVQLGRMDISGIMPNLGGIETKDDRTLNELKGLRKDMADFNDRLSRMQVRMDTGELVGTLADPMDKVLGRKAAIRGRR